jgi:hypothetical protein
MPELLDYEEIVHLGREVSECFSTDTFSAKHCQYSTKAGLLANAVSDIETFLAVTVARQLTIFT